jgi:hypothetical protein
MYNLDKARVAPAVKISLDDGVGWPNCHFKAIGPD